MIDDMLEDAARRIRELEAMLKNEADECNRAWDHCVELDSKIDQLKAQIAWLQAGHQSAGS